MGAWKMATKWVPLDELQAAVADKEAMVDDCDVCAHILWRIENKDIRMRGKTIIYYQINMDSKDLLEPRVHR